jgi:hypothetical protein
MNNYRYNFGWRGSLYRFSNSNFDIIKAEVVSFLVKNNINYDPASLDKSILRQSSIADKKKRIGLAEAVSGAKALLRYASGSTASTLEIERRAGICKDCPLIDRIGGCAPCGAAGKIANFVNSLRTSLRLDQPIPSSIKSSYCGVCDCSLALMVPSKMSAFSESESQNLQRPDICWIKKTSTNYIP